MNIVVVGGGFGGVKAALELSKRHVGKITLISDESYFLHHATLYATATGRDKEESVIPLQAIFQHNPDVTIVKDTLSALDNDRKLIITKNGQYKYDEAILALGSVTTFFGISGMAKHAYGIKSLKEIEKFKEHIREEVVERKLDKEYFVIGAGPTGVELAGALNQYLQELVSLHRIKASKPRVTIVEAAPQILPRMSKTAARIVTKRLKDVGIKVLINHKVEALDKDFIQIEGKKIATSTAIWTSGVANNPFFTKNEHQFPLAKNGRVNVNPHLEALPHVYVIGDGNTVKYSGMAWPALQQAKYVAKHLAKKQASRLSFGFHPRSVMTGLPVGDKWGYVEWFGVYVAGRAGYITRRLMELYGYCKLVSLPKAIAIWRAHDIHHVDE